MKKYAYNEITLLQYIFLIHGAQVGVGQLSLPRLLAESGGTDGWIALILGYILTVMISLIVIQVMKRYPQGTILDLLAKYFGKTAGKAATIIVALYFALLVGTNFLAAGLMIQEWILKQTPLYILLFLFVIPTYLIARNGFRILGRYAEFVFFGSLPVFLFLLIPLHEGHWLHLFPLLKEGWKPVLLSVQSTVYSFVGFDLAFFLYPFLQKKQSAAAGIIVANTLSLLIFLFITLACFVYFSPDEITQYNQPTLNLLKVIEFRFIERLEIVFLSAYLFVISTTWIPYMCCFGLSVGWLLGKQDHRNYIAILLVLIVVAAYIMDPSFSQNKQWLNWVSRSGLIYGCAFPVCIWLYMRMHDYVQRRSGK